MMPRLAPRCASIATWVEAARHGRQARPSRPRRPPSADSSAAHHWPARHETELPPGTSLGPLVANREIAAAAARRAIAVGIADLDRRWETSTMAAGDKFILVLGSILTETVTTTIKTSGVVYQSKMLASGPDNWLKIARLLDDEGLGATVAKLTRSDFERLRSPRYSAAADLVFGRLSAKPYILLVHEGILGYASDEDQSSPATSSMSSDGWREFFESDYFKPVDSQMRDDVLAMFESHGLVVSSYKTNAEASVLAAALVDDALGNLLFRIYVPAGRLYENELEKLLAMFHDWLGSVRGFSVRRDGYRTASGRVVEFFGDARISVGGLRDEMERFAHFLSLIDDHGDAVAMIVGLGLDHARASELVGRYSRDARRVLLDTKHEREKRLLSVQQQLETELSDEASEVSSDVIATLVQQLIPSSPFSASELTGGLAGPGTAQPQVVVNQQFFNHVEGLVAQNLSGPVAVGTTPEALLDAIRAFGGAEAFDLQAALAELNDEQAPTPARIGARQRLKDFLSRNGERVEAAAFRMIWSWLEMRIGMTQ